MEVLGLQVVRGASGVAGEAEGPPEDEEDEAEAEVDFEEERP